MARRPWPSESRATAAFVFDARTERNRSFWRATFGSKQRTTFLGFCRVSPEPMRPQTGELINGKYRLIRLIGDGGMGSVFEARHEYLGATVALKFLHAELARRPGLVARFLREARLSANIKSPHIAHVTDVDQANDGVAYIVMELLEGASLMSLLSQTNKLSLDVALDYTLQMLAGLEAAHAV